MEKKRYESIDEVMIARFRSRLRKARERAGLTQAEVARQLGVTPATYARYETGPTLPTFFHVARIAEIFGVSTDYLVGKRNTTELTDLALALHRSRLSKMSPRDREVILEILKKYEDNNWDE